MRPGAPPPRWLVERPIAHRGLHDAASGIVENSLSAADAAIAAGYAIECDVQLTVDGEAVVFHDWTFDRLTSVRGDVGGVTAAACTAITYKNGGGTIPAFGDLLARVAGRVALVCEIKSRFDGDMRLAERVWKVADGYSGPLAFKSFDPMVISWLRRTTIGSGDRALGMVAQATYPGGEWSGLSLDDRRALSHFLHVGESQPDFLSYRVEDLPHAVPCLCRDGMGLPLMTWTVRRPEQAASARLHADQIVFEGFRP